MSELAQICREQAEELEGMPLLPVCHTASHTCSMQLSFALCCLAAKEVIINHLKRKLSNLEAMASTQESQTPENQPPSSGYRKQAGHR